MMSEKNSSDVVRPICPNCGSRNVAWIQYGRPRWSDSFDEKLERREIVLGTCFISNTSEEWKCNDCGTRFGNIGVEPLVRKSKGEDVPDYIDAHKYSSMNEGAIKKSRMCACFHCEQFFTPNQIEEWVDDIHEEKTALCPYCQTDAVIGDAMDYPLTEGLIKQMRDYWFD